MDVIMLGKGFSPGSDMEGTVEVGVEALEEDDYGFLSAARASLMSRLPLGLRSVSSRNCEIKPNLSLTLTASLC